LLAFGILRARGRERPRGPARMDKQQPLRAPLGPPESGSHSLGERKAADGNRRLMAVMESVA